MRCRTCNYSLWNLKDRVCPECGDPFAPSEYEFVNNSVRFQCPHCSQDYYGDGPRGHLMPPEFDCVSCQRRISMDEMVLLPLAGYDESITQIDRMPWRHRQEIGSVKAWFQTVFRALFKPGKLMRDPGSVGDAFVFYVVTYLIYLAPTVIGIIGLVGYQSMRSGIPFGPGIGMSLVWVLTLIAPMAAALIWAVVAHVILVVTGPTKDGLGATLQAFLYSSAANAIAAIPCFNFYFWWCGTIWWAVSATLMVIERQGVKGWRASVAVIGPLAFLFVAFVGLIIFGMVFAMRAATQFNATMMTPVEEVTPIGDALVDRLAATGWPAHALELVEEGAVGADSFALDSTFTQTMNVPVGLESLESYKFMTQEQQAQLVQDEVDALPQDVIAHRLGDFVFTYHGIDASTADPELWIMIASPDPDIQYWNAVPWNVIVVNLDGSTETLGPTLFRNELDLQNALRQDHGLEPLPMPEDVKHGEPAVPQD